ncbi:MAG: aspartate:alanine exchanger family transporter [Anaerolineae bacterium]
MSALLAEQMLVLFAILAIGSWLGNLSLRGVSLGGAAVFFVGLAFGHFGLTIPKPVMDLGLLLFVYAVGLQAGPRFFRTFRKQGRQFVIVAAAGILAAGLATFALARLLAIPYTVAAGMFTGAVTNTPALAATLDAMNHIDPAQAANVSVGYGIAYPFSIVGVTLLIQFLPRLLRQDVKVAEAEWLAAQQAERPQLQKRQFKVTNPNLDGKRLGDLDTHRLGQVNISRVLLAGQGNQVVAGGPDVVLHVGDVVLVVGAETELNKMRLLIGEEVEVPMEANAKAISRDLYVTEASLAGKRLMDLRVWDRYNVIITRIRRLGLEIAPVGTSTLELGDTLRVVGEESAVAQFAKLVSGDARRIDETNMVPFLIGLALGIAVGLIPFRLPLPAGVGGAGITIKLGAAGGAFLVSLILGHFGRVGPFRLWVPLGAKNLARELGLMLFLGGAGANAGTQLLKVIEQQGAGLFLAGAAITTVSALITLFITYFMLKMNLLTTMGLISGVMTNPPALAAASNQTSTDVPAVTYASAFPVVLIFKILLAQILVQVLRLF